ncbi:hypothetical protein [Rathayibacter sp. VKM Ac-2760]|uniref:hypothetical protein n=1 Tax=Rathayibacter sp. VKM Ac-2760 TaxID=2609253 RepID=UPI0013179B5A|nr:hypothetical protein [Rathayibacter sp. VKM Ac-2760]QHC58854.1 hypothetical protein GSU72_10065 [Rathayibacter sp. VKM Ac-2760]
MTDDLPERDLLRSIDPAAAHRVSEDARLHNLLTVLDRLEPERIEPERRPARAHGLRGRLALAIPAGILLAGAAVLVPVLISGAPGSTPAVSTPAASSGVGAPNALLAGSVTPGGVTILAQISVGTAQFLLGRLGDDIRFGASFDGSDPDDNWETFGDPAPVPAGTVTIANPGNFPDAAPGGIATVTGQAGSDVAGITFHPASGASVAAALSNGYYIAAWIGQEFSGPGLADPGVTVRYTDGSSEDVPFSVLGSE